MQLPPSKWHVSRCYQNLRANFLGHGKSFLAGLTLWLNRLSSKSPFAWWQSKRRYVIYSLQLQKQHLKLPFQFFLARLFFVRITPLWRNQKRIFILREIFSFQINLWRKGACWFISWRYIDLTVKIPYLCKFHLKWSLPSTKLILVILATKSSHYWSFSSTNALLNEMLGVLNLTHSLLMHMVGRAML